MLWYLERYEEIKCWISIFCITFNAKLYIIYIKKVVEIVDENMIDVYKKLILSNNPEFHKLWFKNKILVDFHERNKNNNKEEK